jgi:enoyl-CoA hydratase
LVESVLDELGGFPVPTVAVVDGYAVGIGFVLASLCDLRVISNRAWFGLPALAVGRCGGARHALRCLPDAVVREMYFAGTRLSAEAAQQLGFVNRVVPPDELHAAASELASAVAAHSMSALVMGKRALNLGQQMSVRDGYRVEQAISYQLAVHDASGGDE